MEEIGEQNLNGLPYTRSYECVLNLLDHGIVEEIGEQNLNGLPYTTLKYIYGIEHGVSARKKKLCFPHMIRHGFHTNISYM